MAAERDTTKTPVLPSITRRMVFPVCLLVSSTAMAAEEQPQQRRPAQTADHAKENLCPVRWGKRPRRANGPGAVRYVAEWGPCKPGAVAPVALTPAVQPPQMR